MGRETKKESEKVKVKGVSGEKRIVICPGCFKVFETIAQEPLPQDLIELGCTYYTPARVWHHDCFWRREADEGNLLTAEDLEDLDGEEL